MAPRGLRASLVSAAMLVATLGCGGPAPSGSPGSTETAGGSPPSSPASSPAGASAAPSAGLSASPPRPIASSGSIAVLAADGSLMIVDAGGRSNVLSDVAQGAFGFPTWSPDGSRIAALRSSGSEASVVVFDAADISSPPADPLAIFTSSTIEPFYLSWTPDGQDVSFLASEANELTLRLAPADGSAPLDGSGPGAVVRSGNPFYYDWIESDRLLAHVGVGPEAFLGEIGRDGDPAAPALKAPGDFRSAVVSRDHRTVAFVRGVAGGSGEIVISGRDGSNEHVTSVFGPAALGFDPAGGTIASIGPNEPVQQPPGFPLGPVRLIDAASGDVRTLVDGFVVSFWWSPDSRTIAALRVQPAIARASPATDAMTEVRLMFVDVATGAVRSQPAVQPASRFIDALLPYFDQYALSHRLWAPDSSSFLMPEVSPDGTTHVRVRFPDGEDPIELEGEIGFWSP